MIQLCSSGDETSFIVPAYEFPKERRATAHMASPAWRAENEAIGSDTAYAMFGDRRVFVPRVLPNSLNWHTSELFACDKTKKETLNQEAILRAKGSRVPAGATHIALLVEGPRTYRRKDGVERRGYAAWTRLDGAELTGAIAVDPTHRVYPARVARGVFFTCERQVDRRGTLIGFICERAWVTFSIKEDPADDILSVRVQGAAWSSSEPTLPPGENSHGLDKEWRALMRKAFSGFENFCGPVGPKGTIFGSARGSIADYLKPANLIFV